MKTHRSIVSALVALFLAAANLTGCGEIKVRAGTPVSPTLLESRLKVGESTATDVRRVLGEPAGVGREWLPFHSEPRTVWSYHYEEGQVSLAGSGDSRRIFVWVFLRDTAYDGYVWVSSFPADRGSP